MTKVLTINLVSTPAQWLLVEQRHNAYSVLTNGELALNDEIAAEDQLSFMMHNLQSHLNKKNISYDNLLVLADLNPELAIDLELPFADEKSIHAIILPELEDRLPIEPENFFIHFKVTQELATGRHQTHVSLCPLEKVQTLMAAFKEAKLRPDLITNQAGLCSILLNSIAEAEKNNAIISYKNERWHLAVSIGNLIFFEESIAPVSLDSQPITQNIKFRIKQLELQFGEFEIYSLDSQTEELLTNSSIPNKLHSNFNILPDSIKHHDLGCALLTVTATDNLPIKPALNFSFGKYANNQILVSSIDGLKKLTPSLLIFLVISTICLFAYYYVQNYRIKAIEQAISSTIASSLGRADLKNIPALLEQSTKLESQLQTLGAPTGLNPADTFIQISEDFNKESTVKFNRVRISATKLSIEGLANSYTDIERLQRTLKRKGKVFCKVTSRQSAAGGSRGFVIEAELCQN